MIGDVLWTPPADLRQTTEVGRLMSWLEQHRGLRVRSYDELQRWSVDDLDAFLARLASKGVTLLGRDDKNPSGRFAWILDPDGTKIELWQPIKPDAR